MINIEVEKYPKPILSPKWKEFHKKFSSIRNSGGIIYDKGIKQIILLVTVRHKTDNKSRLHIAKSYDGKTFKLEEKPFIDLNQDSLMGVEDARISKIGDEYFITYTEFKETNDLTYNITRIGLVKTKDFKTYTDRKIILNKWGNNKNCIIFQDENSQKFYAIHRPFSGASDEKSAAYILKTKDFQEWEDLGVFLEPREGMWDSVRVGINSPPINIGKDMLFMLYHGADIETNTYKIGGIIIDKNNPKKILWRSKKPLIEPELRWEIQGEVPNVVFTCNLIPLGNNEFVTYHSGADKYLGMTKLKVKFK